MRRILSAAQGLSGFCPGFSLSGRRPLRESQERRFPGQEGQERGDWPGGGSGLWRRHETASKQRPGFSPGSSACPACPLSVSPALAGNWGLRNCPQVEVDENGKIVDARFKTFGCGSAIASSSLATEWVKGKTVDEALKIKNTDIAKELCLPPVKLHCSMLAEDAIKAALADYKLKQGSNPAGPEKSAASM
uniref:Iron-sulfur cluster assembly enzyme n=1 Tax=Naja naja TaxID=35670 RepID=A0A8C7E682_NAJNA